MSSCPSDQDLLALLGERLDAADESRIVAHVESCDRCQHGLAELTRGDEPNLS
jgi:anti-sigma factor RsiW